MNAYVCMLISCKIQIAQTISLVDVGLKAESDKINTSHLHFIHEGLGLWGRIQRKRKQEGGQEWKARSRAMM